MIPMDEIKTITAEIRAFIDERDWAQFHNPKELAAAIAIEAAELQEQFLWKGYEASEEQVNDPAKIEPVADEIADIAVYLFELADNLGLDLLAEMRRKMAKNAEKYPVEKAKGSNLKYTEL